jgi:predicted small lipoprotein YifL
MKVPLAAALLTALASCCNHGPCITPPPMETSDQTTIAASVAAQLAGAPATGSLSATYSSIVKDTFDKLADNDKALYLFLVAIECYIKEGQVGQEIAKGMAQTVQAKWASKQAATSLTARSKTLDQRSPGVAPRIHSVLKQVGLE